MRTPSTKAKSKNPAKILSIHASKDLKELIETTAKLWRKHHLTYDQARYVSKEVRKALEIKRVKARKRGVIKAKPGEGPQTPRIGGIIYTESAEKVAYFIENADRERLPLLFLQDVSGFMVGTDAEHSGIIRAGARFVEAMATATVPKLVLTLNHASGAGYYAMAGQGFDPDFILSWPTGRMGVMEGESAVQAVYTTKSFQVL